MGKTKKNQKILKIGTDCSGIEAPIQALKNLRIPHRHVFSCENNPYAQQAINLNYNPEYFYDNITSRDHKSLPEIDMYVCGFPCQSFSSESAGKRQGFDDKKGRGIIFFHCLQVIQHKQPKIFVLENVKGLLTHDGGNTFQTIINLLESLKTYNIFYKLLNTKNYGLPQNRERIYIVGIRKNIMKTHFRFPEQIPLKFTVADFLSILPKETHAEYSKITPHMRKIIEDSGVNESENWVINVNTGMKEFATKLKDISPCLLAGNSAFYVTSYQRKITEKEALTLQGFPRNFCTDNIPKSQVYRMAGNTMSVNVLMHLFREIFKVVDL